MQADSTVDDDSDNEFETLFRPVTRDDLILSFDDIVFKKLDDSSCIVDYCYSLCSESRSINLPMIATLQFDDKLNVIKNDDDVILHNILLSIGLCKLTWFWMGFAPKRIVVKVGAHRNTFNLHEMIDKFWNIFYNNILLEFIYVHRTYGIENLLPLKIELDDFDINLSNNNNNNINKTNVKNNHRDKNVLVPIGGGKDSLVVWKLAVDSGRDPTLLYISDNRKEYENNFRIRSIIAETKCHCITIHHNFDCEGFERNATSYFMPTGHPWAALVLFDSLLVSYINNFNEVHFGYEKSANEGNNVFVKNIEVNHQYDKSSVFLSLAEEYIKQFIFNSSHGQIIQLSSPIHHLMEIEISRIFTRELEKFFPLFLSCNEPINYTHWCCKCDKCLFIGLIISAFLCPLKVVAIFQETSIFSNIELIQKCKILIGKHSTITMKPFECVGTISEARAATHLAYIRHIEFNMYDIDIDIDDNERIDRLKQFCMNNKIDNAILPICLQVMSKDLSLIDNDNNANIEMILPDDDIVRLYIT